MSKEEQYTAHRVALLAIAQFFNIKDCGIKSNMDLHCELAKLSDDSAIIILDLLKEYAPIHIRTVEIFNKL